MSSKRQRRRLSPVKRLSTYSASEVENSQMPWRNLAGVSSLKQMDNAMSPSKSRSPPGGGPGPCEGRQCCCCCPCRVPCPCFRAQMSGADSPLAAAIRQDKAYKLNQEEGPNAEDTVFLLRNDDAGWTERPGTKKKQAAPKTSSGIGVKLIEYGLVAGAVVVVVCVANRLSQKPA